MKITKRQLKRIILEEKNKILREMNKDGFEEFGRRFDAAYKQSDGSYSGHPDAVQTERPKYLNKDEAHSYLVNTILEVEEILGTDGVRAALDELGYYSK